MILTALFNLAALLIIAVASVDHFGWLHGIAITAAVYVLMPYSYFEAVNK